MNDRYKPLSHETIFLHMLICYSETRKNPLVQVDSAKIIKSTAIEQIWVS